MTDLLLKLFRERCADKCGGDGDCQKETCSCLAWAEDHTNPPVFYTVAVYTEDQAYGGPEEGGWWYTTGNLIYNLEEGCKNGALPQIFAKREDAVAAAAKLTEGPLERINHYRPAISSVRSQGRYVARVCDEYPEPSFPKERPHYE